MDCLYQLTVQECEDAGSWCKNVQMRYLPSTRAITTADKTAKSPAKRRDKHLGTYVTGPQK